MINKRCIALNKKGKICKNAKCGNFDYCKIHYNVNFNEDDSDDNVLTENFNENDSDDNVLTENFNEDESNDNVLNENFNEDESNDNVLNRNEKNYKSDYENLNLIFNKYTIESKKKDSIYQNQLLKIGIFHFIVFLTIFVITCFVKLEIEKSLTK